MTRRSSRGVATTVALLWTSIAHGQPAPPPEVTATSCAEAHREAQVARRDDRLLDSKRQLIHCSQSACPSLITDDCRPWLDELEQLIPVLVIEVVRGGAPVLATIVVDGEERTSRASELRLPVDPGEHEVKVLVATSPPATRQIRVEPGTDPQPVVIELSAVPPTEEVEPMEVTEPPAADEGPSVATWIVGGAGLVGLGLFAGFGASGLTRRGELDDSGCAPGCDPAEVDAMDRDFLVADIALGAGLGLLAVSTVLFFTTRSDAPPARAQIALSPSPGGLSLRGAF